MKYQVFTETLQLLHTTTDTLHAQEPLLLLAEINPLPSYPLNLCKTDLVIVCALIFIIIFFFLFTFVP